MLLVTAGSMRQAIGVALLACMLASVALVDGALAKDRSRMKDRTLDYYAGQEVSLRLALLSGQVMRVAVRFGPRSPRLVAWRIAPVFPACQSAAAPLLQLVFRVVPAPGAGSEQDVRLPLCMQHVASYHAVSPESVELVFVNHASVPLDELVIVQFGDSALFQPGLAESRDPHPEWPVPRIPPAGLAEVRDLLANATQWPLHNTMAYIEGAGFAQTVTQLQSGQRRMRTVYIEPGQVIGSSRGLDITEVLGDERSCDVRQLEPGHRPVPWQQPSRSALYLGMMQREPLPPGTPPPFPQRDKPCDLWQDTQHGDTWIWCLRDQQLWNVRQMRGNQTLLWLSLAPIPGTLQIQPSVTCLHAQSVPPCITAAWGVPRLPDTQRCRCIAPGYYNGPDCAQRTVCQCADMRTGACPVSQETRVERDLFDLPPCRCYAGFHGRACTLPACGVSIPLQRQVCVTRMSEEREGDDDDDDSFDMGTVGPWLPQPSAGSASAVLACAPGWHGPHCSVSKCARVCGEEEVCGDDGRCQCLPLYRRRPGRPHCQSPPLHAAGVWEVAARESWNPDGAVTWSRNTTDQVVTWLVRFDPAILHASDDIRVVMHSSVPPSSLQGLLICLAWTRVPHPAFGDCVPAIPSPTSPTIDLSAGLVAGRRQVYLSLRPAQPYALPVAARVGIQLLTPAPSRAMILSPLAVLLALCCLVLVVAAALVVYDRRAPRVSGTLQRAHRLVDAPGVKVALLSEADASAAGQPDWPFASESNIAWPRVSHRGPRAHMWSVAPIPQQEAAARDLQRQQAIAAWHAVYDEHPLDVQHRKRFDADDIDGHYNRQEGRHDDHRLLRHHRDARHGQSSGSRRIRRHGHGKQHSRHSHHSHHSNHHSSAVDDHQHHHPSKSVRFSI